MLNGIAWKTQEMIQKTGKIILELIKEESISTPITPPSNELKITSLVCIKLKFTEYLISYWTK